jgi:hypothetical protein
MLKVYTAYSAIIVQIFYAFVFYIIVFSCCDDPLFGPVAFKNGYNSNLYYLVMAIDGVAHV